MDIFSWDFSLEAYLSMFLCVALWLLPFVLLFLIYNMVELIIQRSKFSDEVQSSLKLIWNASAIFVSGLVSLYLMQYAGTVFEPLKPISMKILINTQFIFMEWGVLDYLFSFHLCMS